MQFRSELEVTQTSSGFYIAMICRTMKSKKRGQRDKEETVVNTSGARPEEITARRCFHLVVKSATDTSDAEGARRSHGGPPTTQKGAAEEVVTHSGVDGWGKKLRSNNEQDNLLDSGGSRKELHQVARIQNPGIVISAA
uniref:Uncharacterized protein n=1 Tax=Steinernema glaseri TaxID=37863 RepID=A0A1I7YB95_9BILA